MVLKNISMKMDVYKFCPNLPPPVIPICHPLAKILRPPRGGIGAKMTKSQ